MEPFCLSSNGLLFFKNYGPFLSNECRPNRYVVFEGRFGSHINFFHWIVADVVGNSLRLMWDIVLLVQKANY